MNILVTGGAGYIGSFMVKRLLDEGYRVTVIDSLERGRKEVVDTRALLETGSLLDASFVSSVLEKNNFEAVIHFAAYIAVGESMHHPDEYFRNNTFGSFTLLEQMQKHGINKIIFSSTAGVYGNPQKVPIPEDHPKNPESPYGDSKLLVEKGLSWFNKAYGINSVILRYFNAAGAALDGSMGEAHQEETHLIPNVIKAIMKGTQFKLFGKDYPTKDGTCIRDYIHVFDLVEAHLLALKRLETTPGISAYNVGTGKGYSNIEVINTIKKITGKNLQVVFEERRAGDASILIADNSKIKQELNFSPQYSELETIVETAWKWHNFNAKGKMQKAEF